MIKCDVSLPTKNVNFGGTRDRFVFCGSNLIFPDGRSYQAYNTIPENSTYGWVALPNFDSHEYVPRNSMLAKVVSDGRDNIGTTVYNDIFQWTLSTGQTGTWGITVAGTLFNPYSYAINYQLYGGYGRIGVGSGGTDFFQQVGSAHSVSLPASGPADFHHSFSFTKSTTTESWYMVPILVYQGSGSYALPRIKRLTIGMRRIS